MIAIINYGLGNLSSIQNMFKRIGVDAVITKDPAEIKSADKLLLPGVGHFKKGMENLHASGLKELLDDLVLAEKKPILGICLGAQLMTKHSEEGDIKGLGWVDGNTVKFDSNNTNGLKVPHMGWSEINVVNQNSLLENLPNEPRFYFVHTFHFLFEAKDEVSATSTYGYEFACSFKKENIYGTQFHPEKSHKFGMKILENFNKL
ncbi:MAG: imidazole glycerol phosphate synthase subunit HisH [Chitinophagaceae bacterium]